MNPEQQINLAADAAKDLKGSCYGPSTGGVPPPKPNTEMMQTGSVNAEGLSHMGNVSTGDGAVGSPHTSHYTGSNGSDAPDEPVPYVNEEGSSEFAGDGENVEPADERILPPPNLDEMFSEDSIRKLRESIENSPCYQRRLAAYKEQQERLANKTIDVDISPSSSMISPLYKLQFFGSYAKGMINLIQENYIVILLIGMVIMNAILMYNYCKGVSGNKKKCKGKKLKKQIKEKADKATKEKN
ncbi:hypothetical protein AK88_01466 [Plasmodium fragile]|uniref:Skeleton-binding protein 1 n=1 Tax=Plasmodium fragile TaxID=5857 RepID=A0A0D9QT06_PLAFR|nr:uncharacterized protein AK88_01466 [Plasmodium fragile]KJP88776.1 hypothetical protein AK88_01466 [Plasmodium fragile]